MCFSPEASFTSALVLGVIGLYGLTYVKTARQLPLALFPLLFACHQAFEGILWLYLRDHAVSTTLALIAQRGYVFLAYLFFPVYCPYIAWMWETSSSRRLWIGLCMLMGLAVAIAHLERLGGDAIMAKQVGSSIQYPGAGPETTIPYLFATCLPFLLCRDWKIWGLGIFNIIAFFFVWYVYYVTAASVWCFFAAWISLYSVWILHQDKQEVA